MNKGKVFIRAGLWLIKDFRWNHATSSRGLLNLTYKCEWRSRQSSEKVKNKLSDSRLFGQQFPCLLLWPLRQITRASFWFVLKWVGTLLTDYWASACAPFYPMSVQYSNKWFWLADFSAKFSSKFIKKIRDAMTMRPSSCLALLKIFSRTWAWAIWIWTRSSDYPKLCFRKRWTTELNRQKGLFQAQTPKKAIKAENNSNWHVVQIVPTLPKVKLEEDLPRHKR